MRSKSKKEGKPGKSLRLEILQSARASFKIEGIYISESQAKEIFKKVEIKLGK